MIPARVLDILATVVGDSPQLLPTILYNEGWMLRLLLDSLGRAPAESHSLTTPARTRWFSEALLPSPFLMESRSDKLGESFTHADGVLGDIDVSLTGNALLKLSTAAERLVVIEAKMASALSPGVKNAAFYDQAARNVACIAEVVRRAQRKPDEMRQLAFYVIAPEAAIQQGRFEPEIQSAHIDEVVRRRADQYAGRKAEWLSESFAPLLARIEIGCLSWESLLDAAPEADAMALQHFYSACKKYNPLSG